jgi:carboxylate-amine ligase
MYDCRAIEATKDLYWDIWPRPRLGTVEFRICDMPLTLTRVLVLAALIRNLVVATRWVLQESARMRRGDLRHYWVAAENKWLATRYGLEAECIRTPGRNRLTLAADIVRLLDQLQPGARGTGDADFLNSLRAEEPLRAGAEHQRRVYRGTGDWRRVIDEMRLARSAELESARPLD